MPRVLHLNTIMSNHFVQKSQGRPGGTSFHKDGQGALFKDKYGEPSWFKNAMEGQEGPHFIRLGGPSCKHKYGEPYLFKKSQGKPEGLHLNTSTTNLLVQKSQGRPGP